MALLDRVKNILLTPKTEPPHAMPDRFFCFNASTHALAPLSFRAASYSGVFTLLPMLTGEGRAHHGDIRQA